LSHKGFQTPPKDEKGGDEGLIAFHGKIVYGQEAQKSLYGKKWMEGGGE